MNKNIYYKYFFLNIIYFNEIDKWLLLIKAMNIWAIMKG